MRLSWWCPLLNGPVDLRKVKQKIGTDPMNHEIFTNFGDPTPKINMQRNRLF